jgi:hypothetical protein
VLLLMIVIVVMRDERKAEMRKRELRDQVQMRERKKNQ